MSQFKGTKPPNKNSNVRFLSFTDFKLKECSTVINDNGSTAVLFHNRDKFNAILLKEQF